jgi:hypothetical protein
MFYLIYMDTPDVQLPASQPKKKLSPLLIMVGMLGLIFIVLVSYASGRASASTCNKFVLGAQAQDTFMSRLAFVFNLNSERATNIIQLAPTIEPTDTQPTAEPTPEGDEPSMIWAGSNRNPKPTSTPAPNNVIITPDQNNGEASENTITPTPKYKTNWDRTYPTPSVYEIPDQDFDSQSDNRKRKPTPTPTPTPKPAQEKIEPAQIKQIIDNTGINIGKPEITVNTEKPGYTINGEIKDKLFGLLPVVYPITIKINDTSGEIENVSIPWWRTLLGNPFAGNITQIRCGDGVCSTTENYDNCKADCIPVCGNGICEYGEGQDTCPVDCEILPTAEPTTHP